MPIKSGKFKLMKNLLKKQNFIRIYTMHLLITSVFGEKMSTTWTIRTDKKLDKLVDENVRLEILPFKF